MTRSFRHRSSPCSLVFWRVESGGRSSTTDRWQDKGARGARSVGRVFSRGYVANSHVFEGLRSLRSHVFRDAIQILTAMCGHFAMSVEDDFRIRPGRIRSSSSQRARPFISQALAATQRAGGSISRQGRIGRGRSRFGKGQRATVEANRFITQRSRGAVIKARVVRISGRGASLGRISPICAVRASRGMARRRSCSDVTATRSIQRLRRTLRDRSSSFPLYHLAR